MICFILTIRTKTTVERISDVVKQTRARSPSDAAQSTYLVWCAHWDILGFHELSWKKACHTKPSLAMIRVVLYVSFFEDITHKWSFRPMFMRVTIFLFDGVYASVQEIHQKLMDIKMFKSTCQKLWRLPDVSDEGWRNLQIRAPKTAAYYINPMKMRSLWESKTHH